jgi:hypothetical protein
MFQPNSNHNHLSVRSRRSMGQCVAGFKECLEVGEYGRSTDGKTCKHGWIFSQSIVCGD